MAVTSPHQAPGDQVQENKRSSLRVDHHGSSHVTSAAKGEPVATKKSKGHTEIQDGREIEVLGVVTPRFRLVFISVLILTVCLLLVDMLLVLAVRNPSAQAQNFMDLCSRLATIGFGAIIGLLGGEVHVAPAAPQDILNNWTFCTPSHDRPARLLVR
jgi:hypothetical protein